MDRNQLKSILYKNGIPEDAYSLNGGLPNEAYCMNEVKGGWEVYYSERGIKRNLGYYLNESGACKCLLREVGKNFILQDVDC